MKKVFLLCLAALALAISTAAQGGFTTVTGAIVDPNGIPWTGGTISAQLLTPGGAAPTLNGVSFTSTSNVGLLGPGGTFTFRLGDNGVILPAGTTWKFTINISPGVPAPLGKGPQSFTVTTAINCGTNTPATCTSNQMTITAALVPVPALSNVSSAAGGSWGTIIDAKQFGVKADTHFTCGATFANGSNIVTTNSGDVPFVSTDVGKIMWGATTSCEGSSIAVITNLIAKGTITSVDSAHQVHVSNNASNICTPVLGIDGCAFVWGAAGGVDDTAALNSAFAAAVAACGTLLLPGNGYMMISAAITTTGNCTKGEISVLGVSMFGGGIMATPDFNSTGCTINNSCLFSAYQNSGSLPPGNMTFANFSVASFSSNPAVSLTNKNGLMCWSTCIVDHVNFNHFFPSLTQIFSPILIVSALGEYVNVHDVNMLNSGNFWISVLGPAIIHHNAFIGGGGGINHTGGTVQSSQNRYDRNGSTGHDLTIAGNGVFTSENDSFACGSNTTQACIALGNATFIATDLLGSSISGDFLATGSASDVVSIGGSSSSIAATGAHNGIVTAAGSVTKLQNTSVSSGSSNCINNVGTLINLGNVKCTGTFANTGTAFASGPSESGKVTCAASTVTITYKLTYINPPLVLLSDETTAGGAKTTPGATTAVVTCTGATDVVDFSITPNPI